MSIVDPQFSFRICYFEIRALILSASLAIKKKNYAKLGVLSSSQSIGFVKVFY
jgi:hypothetical protein